MAVTRVASTADEVESVSSLTSTSLAGTGSDRAILVFGITADGSPNDLAATDPVTWDVATPEALTELYKPGIQNNYFRPFIYGLAGQSSATDTVTVDLSTTNNDTLIIVYTLAGADQTTPFDTEVTQHLTSGGNVSVNASTTTTGDLVCDFTYHEGAGSLTVGASQTEHHNVETFGSYPYIYGGSTQAGADAGVMTWTQTSSTESFELAVNVNQASSGFTGTVGVTLENYTSAATGAVEVTGTIAQTLADYTSAASGSVVNNIGTIAVTLEDFTSAASGLTGIVNGTVTVTLDPFVSAASGDVVNFIGSSAETLDNFVSAAVGAMEVTGTVSQTLVNYVSSASGSFGPSGSSAVTLADFTASASGTVGDGIEGTIAATLEAFLSNASGTYSDTGTIAITLDNFTPTATGAFEVTGTVAVTLDDFTSIAEGGLPGVDTGFVNRGGVVTSVIKRRR